MNYSRPTKLIPLQLYCPFNNSNSRLISRDQSRLQSKSVITSHKSIHDSCIKSFPRLYYQPAIRHSSFHRSFITGKARVPRQLNPLSHNSQESNSLQISQKATSKKILKENGRRKLMENTETYWISEDSMAQIKFQSMNIKVAEYGEIFVPIKHLKYLLFNDIEKVKEIIIESLRVDSEPRWYFFKYPNMCEYKDVSEFSQDYCINCNSSTEIHLETQLIRNASSQSIRQSYDITFYYPLVSLKAGSDFIEKPATLGLLKNLLTSPSSWQALVLKFLKNLN